MLKRLLPILACLAFAATTLHAQIPEDAAEIRPSAQPRSPRACLGVANAGSTTRVLGTTVKTNDKHFLCLGDTLYINHNGGANLTEDGNPATTPGVGYTFYSCKPTVAGPTYADVKLDPCLVRNPTTNAVIISRGEPSGRDTFFNNGSLQTVYGAGRPIKFYFAPATIYDFFGQGASATPGFESNGDCVNVNVNDGLPQDTFSVVYLNPIKVRITSQTATGGTFTVSGGLPEYDGTATYTSFRIVLSSDPTIVGTITSGSPARNGGSVTFTVPQDGTYLIKAVDGKSCDGFARATFPVLTFQASNEIVSMGDTACVRVSAKGFTGMFSAQCAFQFDPSVVSFVGARNFNLPGLDANNFNLIAGTNTIAFSWNGPVNGTTRADNETLFELCFKAIGANGSVSPIRITDTLSLPIDFYDANGVKYGVNVINGSVKIGDVRYVLTLKADSVRCFGESNGRFMFKPIGGGAPYTYTWRSMTNPGLNGSGTIVASGDSIVVANVPAGKYLVTVTNGGNDLKDTSITVFQPNVLFLNAPTAVNPSCANTTDGSLTLTNFGGGTAPYSFRWSTGSVAQAITGLAAGPYGVTLTDAKGCKDSIPRVSIGVNPISIGSPTVTGATCNGINNGSIAVTGVQGGTPNAGNYTFTWSNGTTQVSASSTISNLAPGTYRLTITDKNGCPRIDSFQVTATRILDATATLGNITCNGQQNGFVSVVATARGPEARPYTFTWTGNVGTPANTVSTTTITRLSAGSYPLSIRDNDGCRLDTTFRIKEPDSLKLTTTVLTGETCRNGGTDGQITVVVTGGTPTNGRYSYRWSRTATDTFANISNLRAGNYTLTVTDSSGCAKTRVFTIAAPVFPTIDSFSIRKATCSDRNDGAARVFYKAGTGNRIDSVRWSNTGFLDSITVVAPGNYTVTITASNGCQRIDTARITAPAPLSIDTVLSKKTDPDCPKNATGTIILVLRGGNSPYAYSWSGGPNTSNSVFASLSAGTYTFTVTDSKGCTPIQTAVTLVDPPSIKVVYSDIEAVSCYGKCSPGDGRVTATASGGTANTGKYSFTWSSGETSNNSNTSRATMLCGKWQTVQISDNNCGIIDSVFVPQPDSFTFYNPIINQPSCFGDRDGNAEIRVQGGTPPYSYFWNNGSTRNSIVNVVAGNYSVVITDAKLCSYQYSVNIRQPQPVRVDTVRGATNNVSCYGLVDGQIKVKRTGGNGGPTNWVWSGGISQSDSASQLKSGVYTIVGTDIKGCSDSITLNLTQPDPIYFYLPPLTQPRCNGDLTTIRIDTAFGSTYSHPFSVSIDNGPQYPIGYYIPVFAGEHKINIIEQVTGCTLDTSVTVREPPAVKVQFDSIDVPNQIAHIFVGLGDSVRLNPRITSALPIDSVSWTPKDYLSFRSDPLRPFVRPLDDRTYTIKIYDVNGCSAENQIFVELDRNRNIYIPNIFSPNGDDRNDYFGIFDGAGVKMINYIRIFDRWGEVMFVKNNIPPGSATQGWDGTFRGKPVDSGVFVYIIEVLFEDGQVLLYRGDVTVAR